MKCVQGEKYAMESERRETGKLAEKDWHSEEEKRGAEELREQL